MKCKKTYLCEIRPSNGNLAKPLRKKWMPVKSNPIIEGQICWAYHFIAEKRDERREKNSTPMKPSRNEILGGDAREVEKGTHLRSFPLPRAENNGGPFRTTLGLENISQSFHAVDKENWSIISSWQTEWIP